jgi:hypothetical protein
VEFRSALFIADILQRVRLIQQFQENEIYCLGFQDTVQRAYSSSCGSDHCGERLKWSLHYLNFRDNLLYMNFVGVRFVFVIRQFRVSEETNCRALRRRTNVSYGVHHRRGGRFLFLCIVSNMWILKMFWSVYRKWYTVLSHDRVWL